MFLLPSANIIGNKNLHFIVDFFCVGDAIRKHNIPFLSVVLARVIVINTVLGRRQCSEERVQIVQIDGAEENKI